MSRPWPSDSFVLDAGALGRSMNGLKQGGFTARDGQYGGTRARFTPGLLPQFDMPPEHPPVDPLPTIALEDLAETHDANLATARSEGFAEGFAAGERTANESLTEDKAAVAAMLSALKDDGAPDRDALAHLLHKTVSALLARLIGDEGVPAHIMAHRIAAAVDMLSEATEPASVRLHPADAAMLAPLLGNDIASTPDPAMARGAYRLETRSTLVEDGPEMWIAQLNDAFERMPLPRAI
jgi:flagellar assembly protein FliH